MAVKYIRDWIDTVGEVNRQSPTHVRVKQLFYVGRNAQNEQAQAISVPNTISIQRSLWIDHLFHTEMEGEPYTYTHRVPLKLQYHKRYQCWFRAFKMNYITA